MSTNNGELLISSLKKSGVISSQVFALSLQKTTATSRMHFGGYDSSYVTNKYKSTFKANRTTDSLICWMSLTSKGYWQVQMDQVYVGSTLVTTLMKAVLDSGASSTYVPTKDYYALYIQIFSKNSASCNIDSSSGILYCDCNSIYDSRYPVLSLKFGGRYTFFMNPSDYLIYDSQTKKCIYTFQEDTDTQAPFWLMGYPFLRAYYAIFDQDNQRVDLAGTFLDSGATVTSLSSSSEQNSDSSDDDTSGLIIYIASSNVSSLEMFLLICLICRIVRKMRENEFKRRNRIHMTHAGQQNLTSLSIIIQLQKQLNWNYQQLNKCQLVFWSLTCTRLNSCDGSTCLSNTLHTTITIYVSIKSISNTSTPLVCLQSQCVLITKHAQGTDEIILKYRLTFNDI